MKNEIIYFYLASGDYGCFSNFSRHSIYLKDKFWPTSEHYFQAQKFPGTHHEESIRMADKPMKAANMGRERSRPIRSDWESVKDNIMREAVMAKFIQHKELTSFLLATGESKLIEHTENDRYWADGGDGTGLNMLGKILMEVREAIHQGHTQYENSNFI